jgi:hypothetical protein
MLSLRLWQGLRHHQTEHGNMEVISDAIREGQRRRIALSVAEAAVEAGG